MKYSLFFLLFLAFGFTACSTYSEKELNEFDQKIAAYVKKQPIPFEKSESGLYYHIERVGEGENFIKLTDKVTFTYEGKLLNGKVFDSTSVGKPAVFNVNRLIAGWQEIFMNLKKGGKATIVVPPQLGYGDHSLPNLPKNSILVFNLEVLNVE